jgi:uncharacterized membrane protein YsdA (DUF1294 family)
LNGLWLIAALYLIAINIITYFAFWIDKGRARQGLYRFSERDLLLLAVLGGSPAALFAQWLLRHKTRKQPFKTYLFCIPGIQFGLAILLLVLSA